MCPALLGAAERASGPQPHFLTSDRCIACHNELITPSGEDVSIGFNWRSSIMGNSSHDPYWQASARRETIDHPKVSSHIQDECSVCHMPITRYEAKLQGKDGEIFSHLPFNLNKEEGRQAADGVSCSVCHQISAEKLGTPESYNGGFVVQPPQLDGISPEYGPYQLDPGQVRIMQTSTGGFRPTTSTDQIKKSELCASCHTLITTAYGPDGEKIGSLPEQMPYKEWLNSDFKDKQTCQDCHMPTVHEPVPITRVFGVPREGVKRHVFVAANFFIQRMLNRYRDELRVDALPQELTAASDYTVSYLKQKAARVAIQNVQRNAGRLQADVVVENLNGHKLPSAFPSRRAWLHFVVLDRKTAFCSNRVSCVPTGPLSVTTMTPITRVTNPTTARSPAATQVEIYEDILGDRKGNVTTGLLQAVGYLKDNRLLPRGFDKHTTDRDIAVVGKALDDPSFTGGGDTVRYSVNIGDVSGPVRVEAELWYQPIGYRWANNLKPYREAAEPRRFTDFYDTMTEETGQVLARASVTR